MNYKYSCSNLNSNNGTVNLTDGNIDSTNTNNYYNYNYNNDDSIAINMRLWIKVIDRDVKRKIEIIKKIDVENWYYRENTFEILNKYLIELNQFIELSEKEREKFLKSVPSQMNAVDHSYKKYFDEEKKLISELFKNMCKDEGTIYKETSKSIQVYIRDTIGKLICTYNELVKIGSEEFNISEIIKYKERINEQVRFNNNNNKKEMLIELLMKIANSDESVGAKRIYLFKKFKDEDYLDLDLDLEINEKVILIVRNADALKNHDIVSSLEFELEDVSKNSDDIFSPSLTATHIIFLHEYLSEEDKGRLVNLQDRSNIAIYYFVRKNLIL